MTADRIHLVRHGQAENPRDVLYGRLPGFPLSAHGWATARAAAAAFHEAGAPVRRVLASPVQRASESAEPWGELFGLDVEIDERLIEPWSLFDGQLYSPTSRLVGARIGGLPRAWPSLLNPWRPGWGEPFAQILSRMQAAMRAASESVDRGEVVLVSHQLPIWLVHRAALGRRPPHLIGERRCSPSSVTSFVPAEGGGFREVGYAGTPVFRGH